MTPRGSDARRPNAASGTAYGVDGCSAGWFYFALARSGAPDWGIASTIKELVSSADDSDRIFVDIPIGLPDGREGRGCDTEARGRLRAPRASSVFPVPVRAALFAATYEEASRVNREASEKGLTRQTFAVLRKIREVDRLLRRSEKARRIVREIHPEICFWALAGGSPMGHSKKKGAGFDKRLALLKGFHPSVLGERVGRSTVRLVAKRLDGAVEALRSAPIEGPHPYLYLDATFLDARWARKVENVSALVAYAVDPDGHRRLLAITLGPEESEDSWSELLEQLLERGLSGVELVIADEHEGLAAAVRRFLPEVRRQRCNRAPAAYRAGQGPASPAQACGARGCRRLPGPRAR